MPRTAQPRPRPRRHLKALPPPLPAPTIASSADGSAAAQGERSPSTSDPALRVRREAAEATLQRATARWQKAGMTPNHAQVAVAAMRAVIARLVAGGLVQEDEAHAELAEHEARILDERFARALQQREEQALTNGATPKRSDDPAGAQGFTSPALTRRERWFGRR